MGNVAFYLDGPASRAFSEAQTNRAPHFAGGHLNLGRPVNGESYTVELWFWNGLPSDARGITGELLSLGSERAAARHWRHERFSWPPAALGEAGRDNRSPGFPSPSQRRGITSP